jgi:hypothetical protein
MSTQRQQCFRVRVRPPPDYISTSFRRLHVARRLAPDTPIDVLQQRLPTRRHP